MRNRFVRNAVGIWLMLSKRPAAPPVLTGSE